MMQTMSIDSYNKASPISFQDTGKALTLATD